MKLSTFIVILLFTLFLSGLELKARAEDPTNWGEPTKDTSWENKEPAKTEKAEKPKKSKKTKKEKKEKKKKLSPAEGSTSVPAAKIEKPIPKPEEAKSEASAEPKAEPVEKANQGRVEEQHSMNSTQILALRAGPHCYSVEYKHEGSEILSCTLPLPITYIKRNCEDNKIVEIGDAQALVTCIGKQHLGLFFRTSAEIVSAELKVNRRPDGRSGTVSSYKVDNTTTNDEKFAKMLPFPELKSLAEKAPEDAPLQFTFSGFAALEYERSARFGYDVGGTNLTAAPNFTNNVAHPTRTTGTFLSDLNFQIKKDRSSLDAVIELGEIYYGDSGSGGSENARSGSIIKVKNIYLSHHLQDGMDARAGVLATLSDPRSFIYNDNTAALQFEYDAKVVKSVLWYGVAQKNRPAADASTNGYLDDHYLSLETNLNFIPGLKNTVYGVFRKLANTSVAQEVSTNTYSTVTGETRSGWAGATVEYQGFDPVTVEATYIGNWNSTVATEKVRDSYFAYLADAKLSYGLSNPQLAFTLEGLATSGAKGATDTSTGYAVLGKRRAFSSPINTAYLMTVATSDGLDDAPGTPKQSVFAKLSQDEGIRILLPTVTATLSKRWTLFTRYGIIRTQEDGSQGSKDFGNEIDIGTVYQATSSATVSADYGRFKPGKFFANRDTAELASLKYKISF